VSGLAADCLEAALGACLFVAFEGFERSWLDAGGRASAPENTSTLEITNRSMLGLYIAAWGKLRSRLDANSARNRVDLDAAAGGPHPRAQAVLILVLNHDWNTGADVT
jgi:hypothetical protein